MVYACRYLRSISFRPQLIIGGIWKFVPERTKYECYESEFWHKSRRLFFYILIYLSNIKSNLDKTYCMFEEIGSERRKDIVQVLAFISHQRCVCRCVFESLFYKKKINFIIFIIVHCWNIKMIKFIITAFL